MTDKEQLIKHLQKNKFTITPEYALKRFQSGDEIRVEMFNGLNSNFYVISTQDKVISKKTILYNDWKYQLKQFLFTHNIRGFRMAVKNNSLLPKKSPPTEVLKDKTFSEAVQKVLDNPLPQEFINKKEYDLHIEEAKKVIQKFQENEKQQQLDCANEINKILQKYKLNLTTVVDKATVLKIVGEMLTNNDINFYILQPELRKLPEEQTV